MQHLPKGIKGLDTSKCHVPEGHELEKVDRALGVPNGTTYRTVLLHGDPTLLNTHLERYGIKLDPLGIVPKEQWNTWKELVVGFGVPLSVIEYIPPEVPIEDLDSWYEKHFNEDLKS